MKSCFLIGGKTISRYEFNITEVTHALHGAFTGSCDPLRSLTPVLWLQARVDDWWPSPDGTKTYDKAVLALARAALEEFERGQQEGRFVLCTKE